MKKRRLWIILVAALLLVAGGGYFAYTRYFALAEKSTEATLETATVQQGDVVITADGSGELVPASEMGMAFRTSGVVDEVVAAVGDRVQQGDLLAQLKTDDLERALAEAESELELAQLDLAEVREGPSETELEDARAALRDAQVSLALAQSAYEKTFDSNLDASVGVRKTEYDWWVGYYQKQKSKYEAGEISQADHDWAMAAMIAAEGRWQEAVNQATIEEIQARNRLVQAQNTAYQRQQALEELENSPTIEDLVRAEVAVDRALVARQRAAADLEAAQLYAPFDAIVMDIAVDTGDQVDTNATILTLATLQEPLIRFWVEESDYGSVVVGNTVNIVFEAFPDDTYAGVVIRVDPVLATVDGTSAVQAWASIEIAWQEGSKGTIFSGMTADVEVIAAESRDALLVPVQALRELGEGQYAVFVVGASGEIEMRPVEIGLSDLANVEILSGLELGEVVSLGE
ncbi:MAG: efflux RND transporter periplasmic adaptor subunit [Anaerolineae bacterium]|nr:efflux RND transporter periplasmic adaptor subunit [Anaerolineae bacterium]